MEAFHDSHDGHYRMPLGAITAGETVELALDVKDAPGASVFLRTWVDGQGEIRYPMTPEADDGSGGGSGGDGTPGAIRFRTALTPQQVAAVWYQFVIACEDGTEMRYGACDRQLGGAGQLVDWEPPSFLLAICGTDGELPAFLQERSAPNAPELAHVFPPFADGSAARVFAANDDVLGIWRRASDGTAACVLVNASDHAACEVAVPLAGEAVSNVVDGYAVPTCSASEAAGAGAIVIDEAVIEPKTGADKSQVPATCADAGRAPKQYAKTRLRQAGSSVLYFHPEQRLGKLMQPGLGVLAHITSLPTREDESEAGGRGNAVPEARANGEIAAENAVRPATGTAAGTTGAPARAFVDWLAQAGVRYWQVLPVSPTDEYGSPYAGISAFAGNTRLLEHAPDPAKPDPDVSTSGEFRAFCEREAAWLEPYACFMAIRQAQGEGKAWQDWPMKYRRFDAKTARAVRNDATLHDLAETCRQGQFAFDRQWRALREYANSKGVQIIGDMPLYVSADSADTWANPELFQLGNDGRPRMVAGCPPDPFAAEGQVWGNPLYDWTVHAGDGFAWWMARLKRTFELYDWVRLDHFIGFARYFSIPAGSAAAEGSYRPGPGLRLFQKAHSEFGALPVIAEDLGLITPAVRALVAACGFPGMDIVQFVDGNDPLSGYAPRPEKVAYTGTHDNQTLIGYCRQRYPHLDAHDTARTLAQSVVESAAPVAVVALQDVLSLGDEARMNVPGTASGNWTWQARAADVDAALPRLQELVALHEQAARCRTTRQSEVAR